MKKFLKFLKNSLLFILALLVLLIVFLYVYYGISANRIEKHEQLAQTNSDKRTSLIKSPEISENSSLLNLLPVPKSVEMHPGIFHIPDALTFQIEPALKEVTEKFLGRWLASRVGYKQPGAGAFLNCTRDTSLARQEYRLTLNPGTASIRYNSDEGLHYALVTLKVLMINYRNNIPCADIQDSPDLQVRGLMLDISRNKVPTLQTLIGIVELLGDLKYNHLELYIEGFSFAYPSFQKLWEGNLTPLTGAEIQKLDSVCRDSYIDLVPNQNSFGHMDAWLATNEYKDLAECPEGYKLMGLITLKSTLDPYDERSLNLVERMTDDLLPNFTSSTFNVNLDEPFELGKGKSKKISSKKGLENVYLDYVLKMHDMTSARNKKMLMWGDIGLRHRDILSRLPKDITLLDWGYESLYPFGKNSYRLDSAGVSFYVCPGTSSWTSITGRTVNMLDNIENAAVNGKKFGAKGLLVTDWGDMGHWQYLPVSYAGYATAGALGWNSGSRNAIPLQRFLDTYVYRDSVSKMAGFTLNMGRYNHFEEFIMFNMTTTMMSFQLGIQDKVMVDAVFEKIMNGITGLMKDIAPELIDTVRNRYTSRINYDYNGLNAFLDHQLAVLGSVKMEVQDSVLIKDEYRNAISLIRLGGELKQYIQKKNSMSVAAQMEHLEKMNRLCSTYLSENKRLWMFRNKPGGYDTSVASLTNLQKGIVQRMELLKKPAFTRSLNRFLEKLSSAGIAIYLKMIA
jgi:hexosaminidase